MGRHFSSSFAFVRGDNVAVVDRKHFIGVDSHTEEARIGLLYHNFISLVYYNMRFQPNPTESTSPFETTSLIFLYTKATNIILCKLVD